MDQLSDMLVFARVVDRGSFTSAAVDLGMSKSMASRRVRRLEERLGVQLLHRTTRRIALTTAGSAYYEHCRRIADEVAAAEQAVLSDRDEARGQVRMTAPRTLGRVLLGPVLPDILADHPDLRLELVLTDRRVDLSEEGFDIGLRLGPPKSAGVEARRMGSIEVVTCAAPAYLETRGRPDSPRDLSSHACLVHTHRQSGTVWRFDGDPEVSLVIAGRFESNEPQVLVDAAIAGLGVARLPRVVLDDALSDGRLEPLFVDRPSPRLELYALVPRRRARSLRVRFLVEALSQALNARWASA